MRKWFLALIMALVFQAGARADVSGYTITSELASIDLSSGTITAIGGSDLFALAFDSSGTLYGAVSNQVYTVNTSTGHVTALSHNLGSFTVQDLTYDWNKGNLVVIGYTSTQFEVHAVGSDGSLGTQYTSSLGSYPRIAGIPNASSEPSMYASNGPSLYKVNLNTGAWTSVGSFGISPYEIGNGLRFDSNGTLWGLGSGVVNGVTQYRTYTINTSTGAATAVATPSSGSSGLAIP